MLQKYATTTFSSEIFQKKFSLKSGMLISACTNVVMQLTIRMRQKLGRCSSSILILNLDFLFYTSMSFSSIDCIFKLVYLGLE